MDLAGVGGICFRIEDGSVRFTNVEIFGCSDDPIHFAGGGGHVVEGSYFHDNLGQVETESGLGASTIGPDNLFVGGNENAVFVNSPGDTVLDNVFRDVNNAAIFVAGAAPGARVVGNQTIDCTVGIGLASNLAGVSIWHNTFVGPLGTGLVVSQADAIDLRNNIFAHLALGLNASSFRFSVNDYNLFFENDTHCNACGGVLGDNSKIDEDPLFANYPGGNLALSTGSPAIDTGIFVIDRNQNGVPDMGALDF
jgi:hypothetical protein